MEQKISTLQNLKDFLSLLSEEQLKQPVKISAEDTEIVLMTEAHVLTCDYIDPSGDCAEPITDYLKGGQFYDEDDDMSDEPIVARKGDIIFYVDPV